MKTSTLILILFFGSAASRMYAQETYINFDSMPTWTSTYYHGVDGTLTNPLGGIGGGTNHCLMIHTDTTCLGVRTITAHTAMLSFTEISGYLKVPSNSNNYKMTFAYKPGNYSATDFVTDTTGWTSIVSFSNTGANGNGNTWTGYFTRFTTLLDTDVTVAIAYSSDSPATMRFDDLLVSPSPPLPVKLVSFNAEKTSNGIALSWETATEINNQQFDVERSINGKTFEKIATIQGNGNSNSIINYSYNDKTYLPVSVIYYRLKQIDFNGDYTYSNVVRYINVANISTDLKIYPNPYADNFNWEYKTASGKKYTLNINDMYGHLVYSQIIEGAVSGTCSPDINLPHGIYILSLNDETSTIERIKLEH